MDPFDAAQAITAQCLCFRSRRVSRLITRAYDEALRPLGLQATQLTLLSAIGTGEEEGHPVSRIAQGLAMDTTTISRNLRPLERDGLVAVDRLANDRRVRVARLTPAGRNLIVAALPLWRAASARLEAALGPKAANDLRLRLDATAAAASPS